MPSACTDPGEPAKRHASRTALATAYLRAAHQLLDARPLLFDDPMAVRLLGDDARRRILAAAPRYRTPPAQYLRSHVVLRARFAEDRLVRAVGRGLSQYVIVGAGFDTFALRRPAWANALRVIEVDHRASRDEKRTRMAAGGLEVPANVVLAAIDFERESLREGLLRHGASPAEPTFFAWLGVTMYLTEVAIDATLESIAGFAEGSEVVLTFMEPPMCTQDGPEGGFPRLAGLVAAAGEPFVSHFEPRAIEAKLLAAGFTRVTLVTPEMTRAYYAGRRDLPLPGRTGIAYARR